MKARELIEALSGVNPDADVIAFDADSGKHEPVTGIVYTPDETRVSVLGVPSQRIRQVSTVEICTDDNR